MSMKHSWLNNTFSIAALFSFRMLGLFMLIPVFTLYATHLEAATPALLGIALGSYGLSQGLLQIPFGLLSDRYGRKPIITFGLILFACGSLYGALTHSIYGMIVARILQGTGAIGSVLIALLADLTPDQHRTKAMAIIGATIGISFSIAMVLSPALTAYFGLSGIFYFTTLLALFGLIILHYRLPTPVKEPFHGENEIKTTQLKQVISNHHLQRLNASIFFQHLVLTSTFFALPLLLQQQLKLGHLSQQWHFYLILMISAFIIMTPIIFFAEKKQWVKIVFLIAIATTSFSQLALAATFQSWLCICAFMFTYFIAFNILEAHLPSLVSKQADLGSKGTAMGVYSSCQFLGIFVGGAVAGIIYQKSGHQGIFITNGILAGLWFIIALFIQPSLYQLTLSIPYQSNFPADNNLLDKIQALAGVQQVAIKNNMIYVRIEKNRFQEGSIEQLLKNLP